MKKIIVLILSGFLLVSLMGNVILLMRLSDKESNGVDVLDNVPNELIGAWEAKAGRKVEVFEDGKVYWTYNSSDAIYTGYIGEIDGHSIVLSQKYEGNGKEDYQSMSEIPEEELQSTYTIYDITMHGKEAFSAQNVDSREYAWSFVKSK